MIPNPAQIYRQRGAGKGSISMDFASGTNFALSAVTWKFTGSSSADFVLSIVPEQAGHDPLELFRITGVGGDGRDVFMRISDEELRHWLFLWDNNPQATDVLRITWTDPDSENTIWQYQTDLLKLSTPVVMEMGEIV